MAPTSNSELGFLLPCGTRVIHGAGSFVKQAFPLESNLPGTMELYSVGNANDPCCPVYRGPAGCLQFNTTCRMPRHVHMATVPDTTEQQTDDENPKMQFVTEKIFIAGGVAVAELAGQYYVFPPKTMVIIAPGVPHAWVAAPKGLDLEALGVAPPKPIDIEEDPLVSLEEPSTVSDGKFLAVYEYDLPTGFYPTAQTERLETSKDYTACADLHDIRIPVMDVDQLIQQASFVWGTTCKKL